MNAEEGDPKTTPSASQEQDHAADHAIAEQLNALGMQFRKSVPPAPSIKSMPEAELKSDRQESVPAPFVVSNSSGAANKSWWRGSVTLPNWVVAVAAVAVMAIIFGPYLAKQAQPVSSPGTTRGSDDASLNIMQKDSLVAAHLDLGAKYEDIALSNHQTSFYQKAYTEYQKAFEIDGYNERVIRALIRVCPKVSGDCGLYKSRYDALRP